MIKYNNELLLLVAINKEKHLFLYSNDQNWLLFKAWVSVQNERLY